MTFKKPQRNVRQRMNGYRLLTSLEKRSAALAFLDPQYRGIMDAMSYGNEGSRQIERAKLRQQDNYEIANFIEEIERVLVGGGHLALWVDKFMIGEGRHMRLLINAPLLKVVDVVHWNKDRIGMGRRFRCQSEYLIIAQKYPHGTAGMWKDRSVSDCYTGRAVRDRHPHAKPTAIIESVIRAVTKPGDLVVDPCAGGYGVLDVCAAMGREFIGCDVI